MNRLLSNYAPSGLPDATASSQAGDPLAGDPLAGDALAGDPLAGDPLALRLRGVHRATAELRRGTPVLLMPAAGQEGEIPALVALTAETAGVAALAAFARLADGDPLLLLSSVRAAAVLHRPVERAEPVALSLPPALRTPECLHALADPTAEQSIPFMPDMLPTPALAQAALALAKLGRLLPAVLVAPVAADAVALADRLGLLRVPAADVLDYPTAAADGLKLVASAAVPLEDAPETRMLAFRSADAAFEHLAIVIGDPAAADAPLVRIHSECFTGDLLGSLRCDCGSQLRGAIQRMATEGCGVLLYLAQEGRGIGLVNKLRAYTMQDRGLDTLDANRALGWEADERSFLVAATMLQSLGLHRVRLLTNNPGKLAALAACGIDVAGRESHIFAANGVNDRYLATKAARFGHLLG
jgi:GTP cyclohydrolase II